MKDIVNKYADMAHFFGEIPHKIELQEFIDTTKQLAQEKIYRYAVHPTESDMWIVKPKAALKDIEAQEEEITHEP